MHIKTSDLESLDMGFGDYTINWGTHICGLYESEAERDEILMGFLSAGSHSGDFRIFIPAERTREDFESEYSRRYPSCCEELHDEDLFSFVRFEEFYLPDGHFDKHRVIKNHEEFYNNISRKKKRNIRASAEMVWALKAGIDLGDLMEYEAGLNLFFPGKRWVSICLYNVNRFSGQIIMNVLRTHPYLITGGIIMANPYYMEPGEWLKKFRNKTI